MLREGEGRGTRLEVLCDCIIECSEQGAGEGGERDSVSNRVKDIGLEGKAGPGLDSTVSADAWDL